MSDDCNVFLQEVWRLCGYGIYAVRYVFPFYRLQTMTYELLLWQDREAVSAEKKIL